MIKIKFQRRVPRAAFKRYLHKLMEFVEGQGVFWKLIEESMNGAVKKAKGNLDFKKTHEPPKMDGYYQWEYLAYEINGTKEQEDEEYKETMQMYGKMLENPNLVKAKERIDSFKQTMSDKVRKFFSKVDAKMEDVLDSGKERIGEKKTYIQLFNEVGIGFDINRTIEQKNEEKSELKSEANTSPEQKISEQKPIIVDAI